MAASPVDLASRTNDARPSSHRLRSPIFIIGCGRSGTTIVYDLLCEHPDLAWFSNYAERWPAVPQLAALSRVRRFERVRRSGSRFVPSPQEGHRIWDRCGPRGEAARNRPLTEADADAREKERVRRLVNEHARYQGKPRFINKNTRNSRRIRYLDAIFPDALFVHVLRDPRAVVASLLAVSWWADLPLWWCGNRTARELSANGSAAETVAAQHWIESVERLLSDRAVIPDDRYLEIRYEHFVEDPEAELGRMMSFAQLQPSNRVLDGLSRRGVENRNQKYRTQLGAPELSAVERIIAPLAQRLDYPLSISGPRDSSR